VKKVFLAERLTFDQLFRMSEPKRAQRSLTVKGPPLEIDSYQDVVYYCFDFKSNPSTTGLRHKGYVKFFKPRNPRQMPLQHLECLVDCTCPDYRYRWAWTNKQRDSGVVGPNSLNQAWNRAPRITNPQGRSGLCKHILAARGYIYGLIAAFPGDEPDTAEKINKLTKYAKKRWSDHAGAMAAAKDRDREMARIRALRNIVGRLPEPAPEPEPEEPLAPDARASAPDDQQPVDPGAFKQAEPPPLPQQPAKPEQAPLAVPPGKRGRGFPAKPQPPKPHGGYGSKAEYDFKRRQGLGDALVREIENPITERVVNSNNGENMNDLKEAIKLVQEMEDDILGGDGASPELPGDIGAPGAEPLEPSEPPISDTAIGADTEGDSALGLLAQMKDLLTQIATAVAPPPEEGAPGEEGLEGGEPGAEGGMPGGEGEMPPEPPTDEEIPSEEGPGGEEEGGGGNPFKDEEEEHANRRPSK
jgi:hypothetical protein